MDIIASLCDQRERAVQLLSRTDARYGFVLRILAQMTDDDIRQYSDDGSFSEATLERIASELRLSLLDDIRKHMGTEPPSEATPESITHELRVSIGVVQNVVTEQIRPALIDNQPYYDDLKTHYEKDHERAERVLNRRGTPYEREFLLYKLIGIWDQKFGFNTLSMRSDEQSRLLKGKLVFEGKVYKDIVALLEESFNKDWPNWREQWKYF